ncbi:protein PBDC1 [Trichonephila clavata]|uniref:Protein PBDC1 n=1 Tax=Trichonephila clavata TaxID=2740835 RepID=A0A8X6H1X7_TRICU|nr:protein PBDC1 [Trichonephila clavata]
MPPNVRKFSDCKKRAWIISQVQNLEIIITGYAKLESLPKCPANDELLQITMKAKKEAIIKNMAISIEFLKPFEGSDDERKFADSTECWAEKIIDHMKMYDDLIYSVPPKDLKLTPHDDVIYDRFMKDFPGFRFDDLRKNSWSDAVVPKFQDFIKKNGGLVEKPLAGTLIRIDCSKSYTEDNLMMVCRMEFLALEIARNKQGLNDNYRRNL